MEDLQLEYCVAIDGRLETISEGQFAILKGASDIQEKVYSTNSANDNSWQFYTPPPNPEIVVNRRVKVKTPPLYVTITATNTGTTNLLQSGYFGLREAPLASVTTTLESKLNSNQNVTQISDIIHALLKYNTCTDLIEGQLSTSTFYPDCSQNYSDLIGGNLNPLAQYYDGIKGAQHQRGGWNILVTSNTPTSATFTVLPFAENLFLGPYHFGHTENIAGFRGIQTIDTTFTFGNLNRMISYIIPDTVNISNLIINATFGANASPSMLFEYLTPRQDMKLPASVPAQYGLFRIDRFPTTATSPMSAPAPPNYPIPQQIVVSNNIQLDQVPEYLYIYCRTNNNNLTPLSADTFLQISNLNITLNGKTGIYASGSIEQLYQISKKNGLEMSFMEFSGGPVITNVGQAPNALGTLIGTCGSVICLRFGEDIPLDWESPGMATNMMLQVNVTVGNVNMSNSIPAPVLYLVTVKNAVLEFLNTSSSLFQGVTPQIVQNSSQYPMITMKDLQMSQGGADSMGKIKSFFKEKVGPWLKDNWPALLKGVVSVVTKGLGEGAQVGGRRHNKRAKSPHRRRRRMHGGADVGGALLQY